MHGLDKFGFSFQLGALANWYASTQYRLRPRISHVATYVHKLSEKPGL